MYNTLITRSNQSMGYVRVIHTVPNAPNVDVYANDILIFENLAYGSYTNYLPIPDGTYRISLYITGAVGSPVIANLLTLNRNEFITVAAVGTLSKIGLLAIHDANEAKQQGKAMVRFLHLSPNAPAVDITLPNGTVIFDNISYQQITPYLGVAPMDYTLQVRVAGTSDVVLTVPNLTLMADRYYTVYAIGLVGGRPELEALLLMDGELR